MGSSNNGQSGGTAYDAAIALATPAEKERLRDLRLRLNMPPDSPEWQFYAVLAPVLEAADRIQTTVASVEERLAALPAVAKKKPGLLARLGSPSRELLAFAVALAMFAAITFFVDGSSARVASIALYSGALALGVTSAAVYVWLYGKRR